MMHGYDKDAAVAFITRCIRKADHPELAEDIPALVPQMIDDSPFPTRREYLEELDD